MKKKNESMEELCVITENSLCILKKSMTKQKKEDDVYI